MSTKVATRTGLFALGFLSIGTQVYLVREFMMVFSDNELMTGMVLAVWMLFTGTGSLLARFVAATTPRPLREAALLMLAGWLPPLMIPAVGVMKVLLVPAGGMAAPLHVLAAATVLQLPFCLLSGFLFTRLSADVPGASPGRAYAWEAAGSLASGALVNFLLIPLVGPGQGIPIMVFLYLAPVMAYVLYATGLRRMMTFTAVAMPLTLLALIAATRITADAGLFPGQQVAAESETPLGRVVMTKSYGQLNFFSNGVLLFSSGNEIASEEIVHYAMLQHPEPKSVLLLSGGCQGTVDEILRYPGAQVDYVETDPALVGMIRRYFPRLRDARVVIHGIDARTFIGQTRNKYDVVLINLPPPTSLQLNRYYTDEFVKELAAVMNPGAVASWSLPTGSDYISDKAGRMHRVLWNTLQLHFPHILVFPGQRNFFLASTRPLSVDVPVRVEQRGMVTRYVNVYYLDTAGIRERSERLMRPLRQQAPESGIVNGDLRPVLVWYQQAWWLSFHGGGSALALMVILALMVLPLATLNPVTAGMYSGGFTLAATEVILIFGFQVLCGNLFRMIGIIIMIMMAGLAAGAGSAFPVHPSDHRKIYRWLQLIVGSVALAVVIAINLLHSIRPPREILYGGFALAAFIPAFLVGMEFRMATSVSQGSLRNRMSGNYSADLFGSAAGAMITVFFLLPAAGLVLSGVVLLAFNVLTMMLFRFREKRAG